MDEKDQKIQEMEQQLREMQREVDTLKQNASPHRHDNRKRLKPWKIILMAVGILVAIVVVLLVAVFALMNSDKQSPAMAEQMIRAIVEQDADGAYAMTYPGALEREEFDQGFAEMCAAWRTGGGGDTFVLKRTSWSMNASGGATQYTSGYEVTSGEARFAFKLIRVTKGDNTGIIGAQISQILP
ncbi:MAG: DNA replication initiation control protein YabA [Clostridiales bacterium]|nr:DNA replication initiation control protein YabA [Clostridiales bacterium]